MSLAGLAGAGVMASFALAPAKATTLSQLKNLGPADGEAFDADMADAARATPDGTPIEEAQWGPPGPPPPRRGWGPPPRRRWRRRRRRVCGWRRNRWGRPYRTCWYVWR